jgi:hypothetical protein
MKKLLLSLIASLLILSAFASDYYYSKGSKLRLKMWDMSMFSVVLDGQLMASQTNQFVAVNLAPGNHRIKIFKNFYGGYGMSYHKEIVYNGYIDIPAHSKVIAKINKFHDLQIIEIESLCQEYDEDSYYSQYDYNSSCNNNYYSVSAMDYSSFYGLKQSIDNVSFDSSKLKIAKQAIGMNNLSSQQVYELMQLFSFESSKLEIAKYAYNSVVDKQNFYIVNNAFSFSSSIDELNSYIH